MIRSRVVVLYTLFAALSICTNIAAQKVLVMSTSVPYAIPLSVFVGTTVGLGVKFVLDKLWIFDYQHCDIAHGIRSSVLYCTMGGVTTLTFWFFEFGAEYLFGSQTARPGGAVIGPMLGYWAKYHPDRKFVFR